MRRALFILFLFAAAASAETPRLAVVIVIDQFPSGNLDRMPRGGNLEKIMRSAAVFPDALQDHVPTTTAPGHASISTGRSPGVHGITGNDIYDRASGKTTAAIDDPKWGASAWRLASPTLADAFREKYPDCRIVSVSIKDRSAIFLAGKSSTVVLWFSHLRRAFVSSAAFPPVPGWAAEVNRKIGWLNENVKPPFLKFDWSSSPAADVAVVAVASAAVAAERLGRHDTPDLLLVSLSASDGIGHRWGPDSEQMTAQLRELDQRIGELVAIAESAAPGQTVYALTSDHGVLPVPESPAGRRLKARRVHPNDLRQRMESGLQDTRPGKGPWITRMDSPNVHLNTELMKTVGDRRAWLREAAAVVAKLPEIAAVYVPGESGPDDEYAALFRRSVFPGRSGDFLFRLKPGILLTKSKGGTSHGAPYAYDVNVPAIFWGAGIQAGRFKTHVSVESIAPTLAKILGVPLAPADGRVLTEALKP